MLSSMGGTCTSWLQQHLKSVPSVSNLMREKQSCCRTHELWHLSLHSWHPWGTHALVFTFRDQGHTSLLWPILSLSHLIILRDLSVTFPLRVCWRVSIHWQSPPILPDFQDCLKSANPSLLQVPRLRIFNLKIALRRRTVIIFYPSSTFPSLEPSPFSLSAMLQFLSKLPFSSNIPWSRWSFFSVTLSTDSHPPPPNLSFPYLLSHIYF